MAVVWCEAAKYTASPERAVDWVNAGNCSCCATVSPEVDMKNDTLRNVTTAVTLTDRRVMLVMVMVKARVRVRVELGLGLG